jgi:hypothetical protein
MGQSSVRSKNGPLVAVVAAVAMLAVVGGGAVAARSGPKSLDGDGAAAPLPGPTSTMPAGSGPISPKPTASPRATVAAQPTPTLPAQVKLKLTELPKGRAPQLAYLDGRVIRGGAGPDTTIPGRQNILGAVRFSGEVLVILEVGLGGGELARLSAGSDTLDPQRVADVQSVVASLNGDRAGYGTARSNADHTRAKGSAVYWETMGAPQDRRTLKRPDDWGTKVLAVVGDTVYFKSDTDPNGTTSTLSSWQSNTGKVTRIKTVNSPVGVDTAGTAAVDFVAGGAQTFCSTVTDLGNGKRRWRTCEYSVNGFTPDDSTVIATPDFHNGGSDPFTAALDANTGNVRREWSGAEFLESVAEDDDHLLMVADSGEGSMSAIIRCTIASGSCELATPLAKNARYDVRLLGAWT